MPAVVRCPIAEKRSRLVLFVRGLSIRTVETACRQPAPHLGIGPTRDSRSVWGPPQGCLNLKVPPLLVLCAVFGSSRGTRKIEGHTMTVYLTIEASQPSGKS